MTALSIRVLGELQVEVDGRAWSAPASRPARALLGYLALEPGPRPRQHVAADLWPDVLDSSARASLRSAMWALRRDLPKGAADRLISTRTTIGLVDDAMLWTDLRAFGDALRTGRPDAALQLRRGPLLEAFDDEWALRARDAFDGSVGEATAALVAAALKRGDREAAIGWARRRAEEVPRDEAAARTLMSALASCGEGAAALEVFLRLSDRLRRELAVAPATATRELADSLRAAHRPRAAPGARLIGRDDDLQRLEVARRCITARQLGVAAISGEPGIGKTTLAGDMLRRAAGDGARVAACAGSPIASAAPYAQWFELVRDLDAMYADASTWADGVPLELRRARLRESAVDVVDRGAADDGLALLIDDAHAADAASLELLAYVGRRLRDRPLLVVVTRREFPRCAAVDGLLAALATIAAHSVALELRPLAPPRIADILRAHTGATAQDVQRAVALADGNPFLALEAARSLERGEEPAAGLLGMVRAALGRMSPEARDIAELAAVAGGRLTGRQLLDLNAGPATDQILDTGLFATDRGGMRFRHGLLHEAVCREIVSPRRALLHQRAAELVTEPAARAHHLRHAGCYDRAAAALADAADRALALGAVDEAARLLSDAVGIDQSNPSLRLKLARTEAWRGNGPAADEQLERAVDLHDPRDRAALGRLWLEAAQWYRSSLCDPRRTRDAAEQALRHLDRASEAGADALTAYAWSLALLGELDAAERHVVAATRLDSAGRLAFDLALVRAHVLVMRGEVRRSLEAFQKAAAGVRPSGRPDLAYSVWIHAAAVAAFAGDVARSLHYVERCLDDVGRLAYLRVPALAARGYLRARIELHGQALADADAQLELARSAGDAGLLAVAEHDAGMIALAGARHRAAVGHLTAALDADAPVSRATALLARAEALARLGRADAAEADLRAVALIPLRPADAPHALVPRLTWIQGLVARARRDERLARRRLEEAADGWRRLLADADEGPMDAWVANIVDLGRPPVAGLVEPRHELERTLAELRATATEVAA